MGRSINIDDINKGADIMHEIDIMSSIRENKTFLCNTCQYCVHIGAVAECENDMFIPIAIERAQLYTPIEFECGYYIKR